MSRLVEVLTRPVLKRGRRDVQGPFGAVESSKGISSQYPHDAVGADFDSVDLVAGIWG